MDLLWSLMVGWAMSISLQVLGRALLVLLVSLLVFVSSLDEGGLVLVLLHLSELDSSVTTLLGKDDWLSLGVNESVSL